MTVKYQTMPPLSTDEYNDLAESIREQGVQVPIIVDEHGVVIDGHHRQKIADTLGVVPPMVTKVGLSDADKIALSISLNVHRRQLTREQRRELVTRAVVAQPEKSNREHARTAGVDHKTVAAVRNDLEERGEIPHVEERTDSLGRQQPATKPTVTTTRTESVKEQITADADTGEVIELRPVFTATHTAKTALEGDALVADSAKTNAQAITKALETLDSMRWPEHRQRVIEKWWPRATQDGTVPPWGRELFTPESIRNIAQAMQELAVELERNQS